MECKKKCYIIFVKQFLKSFFSLIESMVFFYVTNFLNLKLYRFPILFIVKNWRTEIKVKYA